MVLRTIPAATLWLTPPFRLRVVTLVWNGCKRPRVSDFVFDVSCPAVVCWDHGHRKVIEAWAYLVSLNPHMNYVIYVCLLSVDLRSEL